LRGPWNFNGNMKRPAGPALKKVDGKRGLLDEPSAELGRHEHLPEYFWSAS
jgi:hypothetical protein